MTIEVKNSRNYSATVIRVPELRKAQNSDNLYVIDKLGITAIVDGSWLDRVGELALLFPAEVQLAGDILYENNMYSNQERNKNQAAKGYVDKNQRVRAIKLRGNISNGLALPMSALEFRDSNYAAVEGDVFDTLDGVTVCRKYEIETKSAPLTRSERQGAKVLKRVEDTFLPQHYDTGQWMRERDGVDDEQMLIVTQKLHGTSVRLANTVVKRDLGWRDRLAKFFGVQVREHEYAVVAGSKRVIKDPNNPNQAHFYGTDVWTEALEIWGDSIPKNHIVYGELVGFVPSTGAEIQKGHTYECDDDSLGDEMELYVYRVAVVTENGDMVDLSWSQVKAFCDQHGLEHVPQLAEMRKYAFDIEDFNELDFWAENAKHWSENGEDLYDQEPIMLSEGGTGADEGVAIRIERGLVPEFFKYKNKSHYLYETAQLDTGEADMESQG